MCLNAACPTSARECVQENGAGSRLHPAHGRRQHGSSGTQGVVEAAHSPCSTNHPTTTQSTKVRCDRQLCTWTDKRGGSQCWQLATPARRQALAVSNANMQGTTHSACSAGTPTRHVLQLREGTGTHAASATSVALYTCACGCACAGMHGGEH